MTPGSRLTVKKHNLLWMVSAEKFSLRVVMLIIEFEWDYPPVPSSLSSTDESLIKDAECWKSSEFLKDIFDTQVVTKVAANCKTQFLKYKHLEDGTWAWTFMADDAIKSGFHVRVEESKPDWAKFVKRTKIEDCCAPDNCKNFEECSCQLKYGLAKHVLELCPLERLCRSG